MGVPFVAQLGFAEVDSSGPIVPLSGSADASVQFYKLTQTPILINTSFNIRGEPIVCSPQDAFKCFMGTNLDVLVIENYILEKSKQNKKLMKDYKKDFSLD